MIVGKPKPIKEIAAFVSEFKHVVVLGCGTCVAVCLTGGDREASALARELTHPGLYDHAPPSFEVKTIERQCERDMVKAFVDIPSQCEAILSLACGAGVQTLAAVFPQIPVLPALNTTFLGALDEPGVWREKCRGCGDCLLAYTGGICPVTLCAKRLLNGPCGGSHGGKCEISEEVECAWSIIIARLTDLGRGDLYERILPPRDWSSDRGGGPRTMRYPE